MGLSWLRAARDGVELLVHVQPGAAVLGVCGIHGDALKIRIRARAVQGAANAALTDYLALLLGLSHGEVRILRGEKSRRKTIWLALSHEQAESRLMGITQ